MRKPVQNIGASVRARLLNLAKERNQPFELLLIRYTLERFLYRLSKSKHRERFVLKGAMLMRHWLDDPHRPTRDLDLLGFGDSDPDLTLKVFREICAIKADDAVVFDIDGLVVDRVRDESGYGGLRLKTYATVDGARVRRNRTADYRHCGRPWSRWRRSRRMRRIVRRWRGRDQDRHGRAYRAEAVDHRRGRADPDRPYQSRDPAILPRAGSYRPDRSEGAADPLSAQSATTVERPLGAIWRRCAW